MNNLVLILSMCQLLKISTGTCPEIVNNEDYNEEGRRLCAKVYEAEGDCVGKAWHIYDQAGHVSHKEQGKEHVTSGSSYFYYKMRSVVVQDKCTLRTYYNYDFTTPLGRFDGPGRFAKGVYNEDEFEDFYSATCNCEKETKQECIAEEKLETVQVCDVTSSLVDTTCSYTKHVGTTSSKSKSNSKSQETGFTQGLGPAFAHLGFSQSTNYNWGETTDESLQKDTTTEVTVAAPAGTILTIQQVVGKCGDITFRTEKVIVSHKLKDENSSCKPTDGYEVLITCDATYSMVIPQNKSELHDSRLKRNNRLNCTLITI